LIYVAARKHPTIGIGIGTVVGIVNEASESVPDVLTVSCDELAVMYRSSMADVDVVDDEHRLASGATDDKALMGRRAVRIGQHAGDGCGDRHPWAALVLSIRPPYLAAAGLCRMTGSLTRFAMAGEPRQDGQG